MYLMMCRLFTVLLRNEILIATLFFVRIKVLIVCFISHTVYLFERKVTLRINHKNNIIIKTPKNHVVEIFYNNIKLT